METISGSRKRNPLVCRLLVRPAYWNGISWFPNMANSQRIGREKATLDSFQRMDLSNFNLAISVGSTSANT